MENHPLLAIAAKHGYCQILDVVLSSGVNVNIRDKEGRTTLMLAVIKGQMSSVVHLIESGADPNLKDKSGMTALKYADKYNRYKIKHYLLRNGAMLLY